MTRSGSFPKLGVVLSAGGSAFETAFSLSGLPGDLFHVVTDRACSAEVRAARLGIACERVEARDREELSAQIAASFVAAECRLTLLHFDRLVTSALFNALLTFNVHPSLLPAFPGQDGVRDAAAEKSRFQGATLHVVDEGVDTGPIVSQCIHAVPTGASLDWRRHLAYVQKVIVTLSLFDLALSGRIDPAKGGLEAVNLSGLPNGSMINPEFECMPIRSSVARFLECELQVG